MGLHLLAGITGSIGSGPLFRTLPTVVSTLKHSKDSAGSPWCSTICSARSLGVAWVQPFLDQVRRQHHGAPVVDVHHAAGAVSGDDHVPGMLARAFIGIWQLSNGGAQHGPAILPVYQIGLLLRSSLVHPLKPVVDGRDCPVRLQ